MENEIWKDIEGYEGKYQISNLGRFKSLGRYIKCNHYQYTQKWWPERILKLRTNTLGYKIASLERTEKENRQRVHRLVALAFIPNPENKPEINHKNGISGDNRVENLEWCTHKENMHHAVNVLKRKLGVKGRCGKLSTSSKPVLQFTLNGEFVKEYECGKQASVAMGCCDDNIYSAASLRTNRITACGFIWKYKEDYINE